VIVIVSTVIIFIHHVVILSLQMKSKPQTIGGGAPSCDYISKNHIFSMRACTYKICNIIHEMCSMTLV